MNRVQVKMAPFIGAGSSGNNKDFVNLLGNLIFIRLMGKGNLGDQQGFCRVNHLALAKGKFFVMLQQEQITQHGGDFKIEPVLIFSIYSR